VLICAPASSSSSNYFDTAQPSTGTARAAPRRLDGKNARLGSIVELTGQESQDAVVEIRALRGSQRSSVYRECVVSDDLFRRLLTAAATRGFRSLTALEPHGPHKLDKQHAWRFAREVAEVQDSLREPEVAAIIEVALWCAHATHSSWLTIRRRTPEHNGGSAE